MFSNQANYKPVAISQVVFAVTLAVLAPAISLGAPSWTMSVTSTVGDPIGQGVIRGFSEIGGMLTTPDVLDVTGDSLVDYLTFSFAGGDSTTWDLTFATSSFVNSNPGALVPGIFTSAQKAAFADSGHPGLDFSLNGIAASTLTGQFTITAAAFKTTVTGFEVESFAATFEQFAEGLSVGLTGDFRFIADGDVVPPVPLPGTAYLCAIGLLSLWSSRRLHKR